MRLVHAVAGWLSSSKGRGESGVTPHGAFLHWTGLEPVPLCETSYLLRYRTGGANMAAFVCAVCPCEPSYVCFQSFYHATLNGYAIKITCTLIVTVEASVLMYICFDQFVYSVCAPGACEMH